MTFITARASCSGLSLPRLVRGLAVVTVAAGLLVAGNAARAADTIWTSGTTPGAWSTAGNWSSGVPDSTANALMPAGVTVDSNNIGLNEIAMASAGSVAALLACSLALLERPSL